MRHPVVICTSLLLLLPLLALSKGEPTPEKPQPPSSVGKTIANFTLKDCDGKDWSLADAAKKKAVVVVFLGTECPINNAYLPRLAELHKTLRRQGRAVRRHQRATARTRRRASPPTPRNTSCRSPC